jgi:hypothetical protein
MVHSVYSITSVPFDWKIDYTAALEKIKNLSPLAAPLAAKTKNHSITVLDSCYLKPPNNHKQIDENGPI